MTGNILIEGLAIPARIGVYEWEQNIKQTLIFDISLAYDMEPAARSDDVAQCVNYAEVIDRVTEFINATTFFLIERVAEEVAQLILTKYAVEQVTIKVSKPEAIASAANIAIRITRAK